MPKARNLTHLSLECIFPYMDANLRIQLSRRCPNFNRIDNLNPLFIKELSTDRMNFTVNSISYKLGIIKVYNNGKTPQHILKENSQGGIAYDVDKYGFLKGHKVEMGKLKGMEENLEWSINQYFHFDPANPQNIYQKILVDQFKPIKESMESEILPYKLKKENLEPTYTHYIQLIVTNGSKVLIERVAYDRKLEEALDYIIQKFLLRFKLKIRDLEVHQSEFLKSLQDVLIEPVRTVTCSYMSGTDHRDPIIKNAGKLIIIDNTASWRSALHSNPRIHIVNTKVNPFDFIRKCIGARYYREGHISLDIENVEEAIKDIEDTRVEFNGRKEKILEEKGTKYRECVNFRLSEYRDIQLYIEEIPEKNRYTLNVKIIPIEIVLPNFNH